MKISFHRRSETVNLEKLKGIDHLKKRYISRFIRYPREIRGEMDVPVWRRCIPPSPASARRGGVEAIRRGLSETVVYAAEVNYNQTVVHKTARQRYYCHLNGLAPARQASPPSRSRRDAGETWKLNARDRSVIIRDEGGKGTIVGRSELESRKKL